MRMAIVCACCVASANAADAQDTTVVRANGSGAWGSPARLVQELRIGALEGAEEYTFGMIAGLAVGRDGSIFVADYNGPVIRMYDSAGKFVRKVGRSGGGPGEYRAIQGIAVTTDSRIAIWDPANARITVFDGTGEYKESHAVQNAFFSSNSFAVDRAGNYYVKGIRGAPQPGRDPAHYWLKVNPAGQVVDTLSIPLQDSDPSFVLSTPGGYLRPFVRMTSNALSMQGSVIRGRNDRYAFELLQPSGTVTRVVRDFKPVRVRREEGQQWQAWADYFHTMAMNEQARAAASGGRIRVPGASFDFKIPSTKPPFRDLNVDGDGRIWVTRYAEAREVPQTPRKAGDKRPQLTWREPETFDVFEPSGRFVGQIVLPMRTFLMSARGNQLFAVAQGEQDEQYIVRYRIEPAR